jgi:hypothetical protein
VGVKGQGYAGAVNPHYLELTFNNGIDDPESCYESTSDDIDFYIDLLKSRHGRRISGLQSTLLGQCVRGCSMPKVQAVDHGRFVQILNVGDRWICISNVFGETMHDVYVFDSAYARLQVCTILQTSSLLRNDLSADEIRFHIRSYQQQTPGTRLSGFYALAAAKESCMKSDPTGNICDEVAMPEIFKCSLITNMATSFPHIKTSNKTETVTTVNKLHCLCHQASKGNMVQCSECFNWYHTRSCEMK